MKPIELKDFRLKLKARHNDRTCIVISLMDLINKRYGYKIDFNVYLPKYGVNLQRDFVWTLDQKRELIMSVLKGIPIGEFTVVYHENEDNSTDIQVIDGKQRLSALIEFVQNNFSIVVNDTEYYFNDLPKDIMWEFTRFSPIGTVWYSYYDEPISDEDKITIFNHVNFAGTPQDKSHQDMLTKLLQNGKA